jgi:hypothetical protein
MFQLRDKQASLETTRPNSAMILMNERSIQRLRKREMLT